jgi:rhodanese-related sulfurtransferase
MKSLKSLSLLSAIVVSSVLPITALAYGDIYPIDAYNMVTDKSFNASNTYIIDVRTEAEWQWVGHPGPNTLGEGSGLQGKVVNISYEIEKDGVLVVNKKFIKDVNKVFGDNPSATLITICRSGARSAKAAADLEKAGYEGRVYNTLTGFEGAANQRGYRIIGGWVYDGLPYSYVGLGYKGDK